MAAATLATNTTTQTSHNNGAASAQHHSGVTQDVSKTTSVATAAMQNATTEATKPAEKINWREIGETALGICCDLLIGLGWLIGIAAIGGAMYLMATNPIAAGIGLAILILLYMYSALENAHQPPARAGDFP